MLKVEIWEALYCRYPLGAIYLGENRPIRHNIACILRDPEVLGKFAGRVVLHPRFLFMKKPPENT